MYDTTSRRKPPTQRSSEHTCAQCGSLYRRRPGRGEYCSQDCYKSMRRERKQVTCADGLSYQKRHYLANWADYQRKNSARNAKNSEGIRAYKQTYYRAHEGRDKKPVPLRVELVCTCCGKTYTRQPNEAARSRMPYCGMKCRNLHYRERFKGANSHLWQGGKTEAAKILYSSAEYKQWRYEIFKRDGFACQRCGVKDKTIEAHHLKPQSIYPELRFAMNNGVTLCALCHDEVHGQRASIREQPIILLGIVAGWEPCSQSC